MLLREGDRIGDWVVEHPLGEGGMGTVYRAHSVLSARVVAALKVMKPTAEAEARKRFVREAEALAALHHPSIVRVLGVGEDPSRGIVYLAMELAHGETLKARLGRGPLSSGEAGAILLPIAAALEHSHAARIYHRDVKPANIVLGKQGRPVLVDFGIASAAEWDTLTTTGYVGTLAYLPPEVFRGEKVEPLAIDVYGFGLTLHEALTGVPAFRTGAGLGPAAAAAAIGVEKVSHPGFELSGDFPAPLRDIVRQATHPEPGRRPSMTTIRQALQALGHGDRRTAPRAAEGSSPATDHTVTVADPPLPITGRVPWWRSVRLDWLHDPSPERTLLVWVLAGALGGAAVLALLKSGRGGAEERSPETAGSPPAVASPAASGRPQGWTNPTDGLEYAGIPAGSFQMGCTRGDSRCDPAKLPTRAVLIGRPFWLGRTEVPVAAYRRFAEATHRALPPAPPFNEGWAHGDQPMVNVTWHDARGYCAWAGGRLPTEPEWEYAARGGQADWMYPWGNEPPVCQPGAPNGARFSDRSCRSTGPAPVGSYGRSPYGLHDLAGNVWEWCEDEWHPGFTGEAPSTTASGPRRVLRGGDWRNRPELLRVSIRSDWPEGGSKDNIGFRCVVDVDR